MEIPTFVCVDSRLIWWRCRCLSHSWVPWDGPITQGYGSSIDTPSITWVSTQGYRDCRYVPSSTAIHLKTSLLPSQYPGCSSSFCPSPSSHPGRFHCSARHHHDCLPMCDQVCWSWLNVILFQLDNQLTDAYFPTVLSPAPIPQYILRKTGTKPFIELSMMRRTVPERNIDTFR